MTVSASRWAQVLLWLVPALWASNHVIARLADGVIAPHALALARWSLALLFMLPWVWRDLTKHAAALRQEWPRMLVLGALGMWICGAFVYQGGRTTSVTNIGLFYAATPVLISVVSVRLLHERMSPAQWVGVALALFGVVFVIVKGDWQVLLQLHFTVGDVWIIAAAVAWVAYSVLLKRWASALPPLARLAAITLGGITILLPFTVIEWALVAYPPFTLQALWLVFLAALLPGVLSYGAFSFLQRELGASRTALLLYLAPVYGALLGWVLVGEAPQWYHAVGALFILPSIWFSTRR